MAPLARVQLAQIAPSEQGSDSAGAQAYVRQIQKLPLAVEVLVRVAAEVLASRIGHTVDGPAGRAWQPVGWSLPSWPTRPI